MPRVHFVAKARKDNSAVKAGEPYYWWKFRYGGKRLSASPPKPSQLTQSKWAGVYEAREELEALDFSSTSVEEVRDALSSAADRVEEVRDEYQESLDAMPAQEGHVAEGIQERIDHLDALADELRSVEPDDPDEDGEDGEDAVEAAVTEALEQAFGLDWDSPV